MPARAVPAPALVLPPPCVPMPVVKCKQQKHSSCPHTVTVPQLSWLPGGSSADGVRGLQGSSRPPPRWRRHSPCWPARVSARPQATLRVLDARYRSSLRTWRAPGVRPGAMRAMRAGRAALAALLPLACLVCGKNSGTWGVLGPRLHGIWAPHARRRRCSPSPAEPRSMHAGRPLQVKLLGSRRSGHSLTA